MVEGYDCWDKLMRRRGMKRSVRRCKKISDFKKHSEIADGGEKRAPQVVTLESNSELELFVKGCAWWSGLFTQSK